MSNRKGCLIYGLVMLIYSVMMMFPVIIIAILSQDIAWAEPYLPYVYLMILSSYLLAPYLADIVRRKE